MGIGRITTSEEYGYMTAAPNRAEARHQIMSRHLILTMLLESKSVVGDDLGRTSLLGCRIEVI